MYILQEQGEEFLAERLLGLGVDYLVLNFSQLVSVNGEQAILSDDCAVLSDDYAVLERFAGPAGYAEEFGGYYVIAVYDEEWDVTRASLVVSALGLPDRATASSGPIG